MVKGYFKSSRAFTVIELLVVMGVMAFVGTLSLYGIKSTSKSQNITDAQRSFISDLRSLQNKVNNGANGKNYMVLQIVSATRYSVDGVNIDLPSNVTVNNVGYKIFFSNPLYTGHLANQCGSNAFGAVFYACNSSNGIINSGNITLTFSTAGIGSKTVTIEGNGMVINNIYGN